MSLERLSAPERAELRSLARTFLARHSAEPAVRRIVVTEESFDRSVWARLASEVEFLRLGLPEDLGGAGQGWDVLGLLLEESGRALLTAPLLSCLVADAALGACAEHGADAGATDAVRKAIGAGETIVAVAVGRRDGAGRLRAQASTGRDDDGVVLNGAVTPVLDAGASNLILVGADGRDGYGLYLVPTADSHVTVDRLESLDLTRRAYSVVFDQARAEPVLVGDAAAAVAEHVLDLTSLAVASEELGIMQYVLERTVEYVTVRKAFGRTVGSFQSIKHALADVLSDVESVRATVEFAQRHTNEEHFPLMAALVHAQATEGGSRVATNTLLLYGAIGYTWEHHAHLYLRRSKTNEMLFGPPGEHRARLAGLAGL
ncbi:acyl-CoA dehydrogenase family protein [uncultured Jatrophihabitans sp.]|uniref:acyl-CoA dehydrogenase family protein n=1 Tax=uncultured Jatrophihabitans sp. TaxID=1610747 RepID=UPI0035CAE88A